VTDLGQQGLHYDPESAPELGRVQAADQRAGQRPGDLGRKAVHPPALPRGQPVPQAGQRQDVIPDAADHVLGLPHPAARDARPRVQPVQPGQPDELGRVRRPDLGLRHGLTGQQPERRGAGAELRLGRERQVDLQRAGQQENPVGGGAADDVQVVNGAVVGVHDGGPVGYRGGEFGAGGEAERQVDVGPAVFGAGRGGAGQRDAGDAFIRAGGGDEERTQPVSFRNRKQRDLSPGR
jgi:hypothetical protein